MFFVRQCHLPFVHGIWMIRDDPPLPTTSLTRSRSWTRTSPSSTSSERSAVEFASFFLPRQPPRSSAKKTWTERSLLALNVPNPRWQYRTLTTSRLQVVSWRHTREYMQATWDLRSPLPRPPQRCVYTDMQYYYATPRYVC